MPETGGWHVLKAYKADHADRHRVIDATTAELFILGADNRQTTL